MNSHTNPKAGKMLLSDSRKALLGALVGLGRAAESSAHLIDRSLDIYVLKALAACSDLSLPDDEIYEMARAINEEKAILVPDCSSCSAPCGRTDDYDFDKMNEEIDEIITLKEQIIAYTSAKASELLEPALNGESLLLFPFYRALYCIGARDWNEDDLKSVIEEISSL